MDAGAERFGQFQKKKGDNNGNIDYLWAEEAGQADY